jgi:hypothetical protein
MIRLLSDEEAHMLDNHLEYRDSASQLEYREANLFPKAVVELTESGWDIETARWAAGQATMRKPAASVQEITQLAEDIATARKAA